MTIIFLLVYYWSLFQLYLVSIPTRTIRWRMVVVSFLSGVYFTPLAAVLLEQIWIQRVIAQSSDWTVSLFSTQQAAYTVSPFIEELIKLLPLILILCWKKVRDRLGVTDILLIGAALGAGFGFAEITPRIVHLAENLTWWPDHGGGEWMVSSGLSTKLIPGIRQIFTSILPAPLGKGIAFDARFASFAGMRIEVVDYSHHLVWSALAALGVGIFFRSSKKYLAWLALILPIWSGAVHAFENYTNWIFPDANPIWVDFITGAAAVGGFGRWMTPLTVIAFLIGIVLDWRSIKQGVSSEKDLAWSGAEPSGSSHLPGGLSLIPFFRQYGWKGAQIVKNYLLERRSFTLNREISPDSPQLTEWREQLIAKRKLIEAEGKVKSIQSIQNKLLKKRRKSTRYRRMIAVRIMIGLVFLLPSLLYLALGVFPKTHQILEIFNNQIAFYLISGLGVVSGILLLTRIFLFYRGYSTARRSLSGQSLGIYLLGGVVAHGALLMVLAGLALGFLGGSSATPSDLLHISENLDIVLFVDLMMLVFLLLGLFFPPLALTTGFIVGNLLFRVIDFYIAIDSILVLLEKGEENLTQLEQLELRLALLNIILFPIDVVDPIFKSKDAFWELYRMVGEYTDVPLSSLDLALDALPEQPGPVNWSRPREIQGAFNQIRRGDDFVVNQRFLNAQRSYQKARDLMERGSSTPFTTLAIEERLGDALKSQGENQKALEAYQKALDQLPSEESFPGTQANLLVKIGDQHSALSDFEEAQESYQAALRLVQAEGGDPIQLAEIMLKMGEIWHQLGDGEQALELLGQIYDILLQESPRSLDRADLFIDLGEAFLKLADRKLAKRCFQHGLEDYQTLGQPLSEELLLRIDQLD